MKGPPQQQIPLELSDNDSMILKMRLRFMRKHGLQWPFNILQLFSWVSFGYQTGIYYYITTKYLYRGLKESTLVIYSIILLSTIISGFWATISDPTDPFVRNKKL